MRLNELISYIQDGHSDVLNILRDFVVCFICGATSSICKPQWFSYLLDPTTFLPTNSSVAFIAYNRSRLQPQSSSPGLQKPKLSPSSPLILIFPFDPTSSSSSCGPSPTALALRLLTSTSIYFLVSSPWHLTLKTYMPSLMEGFQHEEFATGFLRYRVKELQGAGGSNRKVNTQA